MTVDELVSLLDDLLEDMSITSLLEGSLSLRDVGLLSDGSKSTLVKYVAGERPEANQIMSGPRERPLREPREPLEHEQRLKDALPRNVKLTEDDEIEFTSGEFDGITLP